MDLRQGPCGNQAGPGLLAPVAEQRGESGNSSLRPGAKVPQYPGGAPLFLLILVLQQLDKARYGRCGVGTKLVQGFDRGLPSIFGFVVEQFRERRKGS